MDFSNLTNWWANISTTELVWLAIGFSAQAMFSMRFIIQWFVSEKAKKSVVPVAFWYFSVLGGVTLLSYAIYRSDPVFIAGQAGGLVICLHADVPTLVERLGGADGRPMLQDTNRWSERL